MKEDLKKLIQLLYKLENNKSFSNVYISGSYLNEIINSLEQSKEFIKDQE
tara:strand:+ start:1386 stop:1535 length:150 start_codon:yes stop_codon:yes gene_type:complete